MNRLLDEARAAARGMVVREWALVATGLLGIALAAGLGVVIAARGAVVAPEGELDKALTFDLAIGIYVLTLAALAPAAAFGRASGRVWRKAVVASTLYGYTVETAQNLRGYDPRFTENGDTVDQALGALLGFDALVIMVLFLAFAARFVGRSAERPLFRLGVRYGAASVVAGGFVSGIWMGSNLGDEWGAASILPLHALGFHGLQAIPLVAWLLERAQSGSGAPARSRSLVHGAGLLWLAAVGMVAAQTWLGRPITELTAWTLGAAALLAGWAAVLAAALATAARGPALGPGTELAPPAAPA